MNAIEIITGILSVLNVGGLMGTIVFFRTSLRKARSEAAFAEAEASAKEWGLEDQRIRHLHEMLDRNNDTVEKYITRIDSDRKLREELESKLDDSNKRARELSDRLYKSELEQNRRNEQLIRVTEERDIAIRKADYYKQWMCRRGDCEKREPVNLKLKGLKFEEPV